MPATTTLYPYEVSHDLHVRPYDPHDPTREDDGFGWVDRGEEAAGVQRLDLRGHSEWRRLRFLVEADLPSTEMERVLAGTSDWRTDTSFILSLRCAATKHRRAIVLTPGQPYTWTGEVVLERANARSLVQLDPLLVRTTGIPEGRGSRWEGKGVSPASILADGSSLRLSIDPSERSVRGALDVKWEDFTESDDRWRKAHTRDLFFFDPTGDEPSLWLNSWYQPLHRVLHGTSSGDRAAALRHLTNATIAQTVWVQLFMTAAGAIVDRPEGTEPVLEGWKGDVLASLLPRIFPEAQTDEERMEQLEELLGAPDQLGSLMAAVGTAVQEELGTADLFEKAVRAVETEADL